MSVLHTTGLTGVAVVLLTAIAYTIRISLDNTAGHPALTASFLILNILGWGLGGPLYTRDRRSPLGVALLVLGDTIFPLNLYAPCLLYVPGLRGRAAASAAVVILIGVVYHVRGYRRIESSRFHPSFYPYFFAAAGLALIQLSRLTLGLPALASLLLCIGYAVGLGLLASRRVFEPRVHFALATSVALLVTGALSFWRCVTTGSVAALGALLAASGLLFAQGAMQRGLGPASRAIGTAAYACVTLFFTGSLYAAGAPMVAYVWATAAWVLVLAAVGVLIGDGWADPFKDSAQWSGVGLGIGLALASWASWGPLTGLASPQSPASRLADLPPVAAPIALLAVAAAAGMVSIWRRRHPSIAATHVGFLASVAFMNVAAFAGPLLLVAGGTSLATAVVGEVPGQVGMPFAIGVALLLLSRRAESFYPMGPIDLAGSSALLLAGLNSAGRPLLATGILLGGSLLFLWRSWSRGSAWSHFGFLALATAAAVTFTASPLPLNLSVLTAALVALTPQLANRAKVVATLAWACAAAVAAVGFEAWGGRSPWIFALLWSSLLAGLRGLRPKTPADDSLEDPIGALRLVGHGVAHASGGLLLAFLARGLGWAQGLEAAALALWAWLHQAVLRTTGGRLGDRALSLSLRYAVHALALVSFGLALSLAGPVVWVACALTYSVLCFLIASDLPWEGTGVVRAGYAMTLIGIGLGIASGMTTTLLALTGGAGVFLWRSLREQSFVPHLVFLVLGTGAAAVASFGFRPSLGMLPLALLAVAIALAARGLRAAEGMSAKVRLTLAWALVIASAAIVVSLGLGPSHPEAFAALWLGLPIALLRWERRSGIERRVGRRPSPDRRFAAGADDDWVPRAGFWLSHAAGAAFVWHALPMPPERRLVALAAWAALHLGLTRILAASSAVAAALAARQATHGIAALTLALSAFHWRSGPWAAAACAGVFLVYLAWRWLESRAGLEHGGAIALSEALVLHGAALGIAWIDYYLVSVGLYICFLALRLAPSTSGGRTKLRANVLPALAIALMAVYPFVSLVLTRDETHLAFLASASVMLLYVLGSVAAHAALVYAVCLAFLFGVAWTVLLGDAEPRLWLGMVLAGVLIIAGLKRAEAVGQRLPSGGVR